MVKSYDPLVKSTIHSVSPQGDRGVHPWGSPVALFGKLSPPDPSGVGSSQSHVEPRLVRPPSGMMMMMMMMMMDDDDDDDIYV